MELSTDILVGVVVLLLSYLLLQWYKDPLRKIPGPYGLPLLGSALQVNLSAMHMDFYKFAIRYGPVMRLNMFTKPIVVISSWKASMEALLKKDTDFQGRPSLFRINQVVKTDCAFSSYDNPDYQILRRVTTKGLRSYGAGVAKLEAVIQENLLEVTDVLLAKDGAPVDSYEVCYGFVACVMATILFGEKYSYDDQVCREIHQMNDDIVGCSGLGEPGAIIDFYPFLAKFEFLFPACFKQLRRTNDRMECTIVKRIRQFKDHFDPNDKRGCLHFFIEYLSQEVDINGNSMLRDDMLHGLVVDFCVGGMETTLAGLQQALLELVSDISLQKRIQAEVDEVMGADTPKLSHREDMHLVNSFTYEILRYLSQVPLLLPHMTICDTTVAGYQIPANTMVFFNAFYSAHDGEIYNDPFEFKADRFLDTNGKLVAADHPLRRSFFGFGAGRRQCPGELLGRSRTFLLISAILQKFDLQVEGQIPNKDVRTYRMRTIIDPPKLTSMKFTPRHH